MTSIVVSVRKSFNLCPNHHQLTLSSWFIHLYIKAEKAHSKSKIDYSIVLNSEWPHRINKKNEIIRMKNKKQKIEWHVFVVRTWHWRQTDKKTTRLGILWWQIDSLYVVRDRDKRHSVGQTKYPLSFYRFCRAIANELDSDKCPRSRWASPHTLQKHKQSRHRSVFSFIKRSIFLFFFFLLFISLWIGQKTHTRSLHR